MVNTRKVKIYVLKNPDTLEIRYVGKTVMSLSKRLSNHICNAKKTKHNLHLANWIMSILKLHKRPIIELIEECDYSCWEQREQYWISYYPNLINATLGGDGCMGFTHKPETIEKLKSVNLGRKHTQEFKDAMSTRLKGKKQTKEQIMKRTARNIGRKVTLIAKENMSKAHLGIKQSEESKRKRSESIKAWWRERKSSEDIVKS